MPGVMKTFAVPLLVMKLTKPPGGMLNDWSLPGCIGMPRAGVLVVGKAAVAVVWPNAMNTCCVEP